jgi:tRNA 2-thiouridine synthesizing protein E
MTMTKKDVDAMKSASKYSVDTDIASQQRTQRELELRSWSEQQARETASEIGIELTQDHLQVIQLLREYYLQHGEVKSGRELGDMLNEKFADQGGRKFLRRLFPQGPVTQGMQLAGLAVPAYSEDEGFGTSR